jgi:hypothetical protein
MHTEEEVEDASSMKIEHERDFAGEFSKGNFFLMSI